MGTHPKKGNRRFDPVPAKLVVGTSQGTGHQKMSQQGASPWRTVRLNPPQMGVYLLNAPLRSLAVDKRGREAGSEVI